MKDCIFCKIISKELPNDKIIYEDEHALAFLDIDPLNIGHTLLIPKKHFETIDEMSAEEFSKLSDALTKVIKGISKLSDGLNLLQNNKKIAGQVIPHVHFHLIPRYKGDGHRPEWIRKANITENQSKEFLEKIKSFLK
jgi:histidine triad (HIT) family protein